MYKKILLENTKSVAGTRLFVNIFKLSSQIREFGNRNLTLK